MRSKIPYKLCFTLSKTKQIPFQPRASNVRHIFYSVDVLCSVYFLSLSFFLFEAKIPNAVNPPTIPADAPRALPQPFEPLPSDAFSL